MSEKLLYRLSKHAQRRMAQRGVTVEQMRRTFSHPDRIERDAEDPDVLHAIKRFNRSGDSRVLHVVYDHSRSPWRIVTVFFERKGRRRK